MSRPRKAPGRLVDPRYKVDSADIQVGGEYQYRDGKAYRVERLVPMAGGFLVVATSGEVRVRMKRSLFARDVLRRVA